MAKSNNAFIKKLKAEKKRKKRLAKIDKRVAKKHDSKDGSLESMLAYVDEFGNLTTEPPEKKEVPKKEKTN